MKNNFAPFVRNGHSSVTIVKYPKGMAYYYANGSFSTMSPDDTVVIHHALSGEQYAARRNSLEEVNWYDVSTSYQKDMITYDRMKLNLGDYFKGDPTDDFVSGEEVIKYMEKSPSNLVDAFLKFGVEPNIALKYLDIYYKVKTNTSYATVRRHSDFLKGNRFHKRTPQIEADVRPVPEMEKVSTQDERNYIIVEDFLKEYPYISVVDLVSSLRKVGVSEDVAEWMLYRFMSYSEAKPTKEWLSSLYLIHKTERNYTTKSKDRVTDFGRKDPWWRDINGKSYFNSSKEKENSINQPTNSITMDLTKQINFRFGKLESNLIAISALGIAIANGNGFSAWNDETKELVEVGEFIFKGDVYQIPTREVEAGDVVALPGTGTYAFVEKVNEDGSFIGINAQGARVEYTKRNNLLNMHFYTKVVSMYSMLSGEKGFGGGNPLDGNFNPMMLMFMGQNNAGSNGANSLLEMMMLSNLFSQPKKQTSAAPANAKRTYKKRK